MSTSNSLNSLPKIRQPRSPTDLADGETGICGDFNVCLRHLPKANVISEKFVNFFLAEVLIHANGAPDSERFATDLLRTEILGNPNFKLLPHWVIQEPSFADGYKAHTSVGSERETELYSPRFTRYSSDWSMVSTAKLWLPLRYGMPSARNTLRWSVVDSAMLFQTLNLSPFPYRTSFHNHDYAKNQWKLENHRILLGTSDAYKNFAPSGVNETIMAGIQEGGFPGIVGGFRTFSRIRVVGRRNETTEGAVLPPGGGSLDKMKLHLVVDKDVELFCRNAAISSHYSHWKDEFWHEACRKGLRSSAQVFEHCGTAAELNSVVRMLSYRGHRKEAALVTKEVDVKNEAIKDYIESHFGTANFTLYGGCDAEILKQPGEAASSSSGNGGTSTTGAIDIGALSSLERARHRIGDHRTLKLLLDDPEAIITVAAHSATRCWMLERMAVSLVSAYPKLKIIGTCECDESDNICNSENQHRQATSPQIHDTYPLKIYQVPYDFGLSQGKTRLAQLVETQYLLVLDDDFVRTPHTCIECMLAKMFSNWHTSFLPLDLVGFPVLEDERNFGAYRGKFRLSNTALFLEPFTHGWTPDGCVRVDFCPMVG